MRRGLTPQVFATNSLHLLCTFIEHTETMFIKNTETMLIEHFESIDCGFEGEVGTTFSLKFKSLNFLKQSNVALKGEGGSTFALKALLCQAVEEGATVVAPSELHVVVDFEPGKDRM